MLPRIWIVLLVVLLVAAPAESTLGETVEAKAGMSLCDNDDATHITVVALLENTPDPALSSIRDDVTVPPAPAQNRIFRPPRPSFD